MMTDYFPFVCLGFIMGFVIGYIVAMFDKWMWWDGE